MGATTVEVSTNHVAMVSHPDEVLQLIKTAAEAVPATTKFGHRAAATYLCVDEADVLRDEGEAYAAKLRSAGGPVTTVRYNGTIHDLMLLDALSETRATRAAIDQATSFLRAGLGTA